MTTPPLTLIDHTSIDHTAQLRLAYFAIGDVYLNTSIRTGLDWYSPLLFDHVVKGQSGGQKGWSDIRSGLDWYTPPLL